MADFAKRPEDQLQNIVDALVEDILDTPGEQLVSEVAEDFGDPNLMAQRFDEALLLRAYEAKPQRRVTPKLMDRVRTVWHAASFRYAIAPTAAIILIVALVELLRFLHADLSPNRAGTDASRTSKDLEMVIIWPSTPQAGIDLCNKLKAENVTCNLMVRMPRNQVADFCKKIEFGGNACQSSFIAGMPDNTAR